ncbi:hypothetical protein ACIP69_18005 [Streptomyces hygroscopicus]|uniref:hypothetical protein n=1 Tax=Streptomyces hygroscopicus TaxID=1912 RepID=UPI003807AE38
MSIVRVDTVALTGQQVTDERMVPPDGFREGTDRVRGTASRVVHDPSEDLSASKVIAHTHRLSIGTIRLSMGTVNQI